MKNLYSKSLMAAVAVMMLASCSNEEVVNVPVTNNDVTIALSVRGTKAASNDMNFNGQKKIVNVAVVPYAANVAQKPVVWGTVTPTEAVTPVAKTTQLLSSVNLFKVYGNLTPDQYEEVNKGTFGLKDNAFNLVKSGVADHTTYYAPHPALYYFKNASDFQVASDGATWAEATGWGTPDDGTVGSSKYVKISGVNYAVGSLAIAVMDGAQNIFTTNDGAPVVNVEDAIEITGVVIDDQQDFTLDFVPVANKRQVYDTAAKGTFGTTISGASDAAANGNIFAIVSPSIVGENVNVNIEFKVKDGHKFTNAAGEEITSGEYFYLGMDLTPTTDNEVFEADHLTKVNATVKNWGLASETPVVVTDAEIGVEFDVDWEEGNLYNVEI